MTTTVTMTLDELRNLPPLTEKEKRIIRDARPIPTSDCPKLTAEQRTRLHNKYELAAMGREPSLAAYRSVNV